MRELNPRLVPTGALYLIKLIKSKGFEAYLVGGCVRDMLLGSEPKDWDICTSAEPKTIINILKGTKCKYHTVGIEFGTITVLLTDGDYEITTYRTEGVYSDNRHPEEVRFVHAIDEDLSRRDFTINALAYDPIDNELIDLFGGCKDLKNGIIRTVGDANVRFKEDSLRIIRALRFAIRYKFDIEDKTLEAMEKHKESIQSVSKERITAELEKILTCGEPIFIWFNRCDWLITEIIPEIKPCIGFWQNNKYHKHNVYDHLLAVTDLCKSNKFEIKLAALLHDVAKPDCYVVDDNGGGHFYGHPDVSAEMFKYIANKDLRLTNEQSERVYTLIKYHDNIVAKTRASVKRMLNKIGVDAFTDWFILKQADLDDHNYPDGKPKWYMDITLLQSIMADIIDEQACFSLKDLAINGRDIMELYQCKPGKHIGTVLATLLDEVIDEKISNDYNSLKERALQLKDDIL